MTKILIIDDNKDILFALSEICNYKGWHPFTAESVEKGIELIKDHEVDLIIIDYHLPVINGMVGVKLIRALSPTVPIIVLTVEESQEIADAFIEAGANDFALKPIKAPDLIARLSVHLNKAAKIQIEKKEYVDYKTYTKGISVSTLEIIESYMKEKCEPLTISAISKETGLAYQTVHRYLHHLVEHQVVALEQNYGKVGRPKQYFSWMNEK